MRQRQDRANGAAAAVSIVAKRLRTSAKGFTGAISGGSGTAALERA
jgi:hypothetical protein